MMMITKSKPNENLVLKMSIEIFKSKAYTCATVGFSCWEICRLKRTKPYYP